MMHRDEIVRYLDERLSIAAIDDRSANGLQVEGCDEVTRIALATDAAMAVYREAQARGCQLVLAHHGLIWGGLQAIRGREREHVKFLLDHGISLYAAHLPLDLHAEVGNNAELARIAGLEGIAPFGAYHGTPIGCRGQLGAPLAVGELAERCRSEVGGEPLILDFGPPTVRSVGVVSGGGSSTLPEAIALGLDCLITGEPAHQDHHLALEGKIHVIYLGHYHSETVGVKALGAELAERFGIEAVFVDVPTRV